MARAAIVDRLVKWFMDVAPFGGLGHQLSPDGVAAKSGSRPIACDLSARRSGSQGPLAASTVSDVGCANLAATSLRQPGGDHETGVVAAAELIAAIAIAALVSILHWP
jgi:hypothetical protein